MPDFIKNFWQANLEEIRANKIRFAAILALLVLAIIFALDDYSSAGEEISLSQPTPPIQTAEIPDASVIPARNIPASNNITEIAGANPAELYVHDPFRQPPPQFIPEPEELPEPETIELPPIIFTPPEISVAQEPPPPEFILRGTAVSGNHKSAIIHKISSGDKQENIIVNIGDTLGGRRVVEISADFVTLDDGTQIFLAL